MDHLAVIKQHKDALIQNKHHDTLLSIEKSKLTFECECLVEKQMNYICMFPEVYTEN